MNGNNPQPASLLGIGPVTFVALRRHVLRLAVPPADRSHDLPDDDRAAPQRDLAQPRAPRRRRHRPRRTDRPALHPVRLDGRDHRRSGHDDDARLLPDEPAAPERPAGRGRLALPRAARHQRRGRHLPVVRRPRELLARGELGLQPRVHVGLHAVLLLRLSRPADADAAHEARAVGRQRLADVRRVARGARRRLPVELAPARVDLARQLVLRGSRGRGRSGLAARSTPTTICRSATTRAATAASRARSPSRSSPTSATSTAATRRRAGWAALSSRTTSSGTRAGRPALRVDFFDDETQAISTKFPVGSPYALPDTGKLVVGGVSVTIDYWPSPWLLTRLEYAHREANQPYFSGRGGITGPGGVPARAIRRRSRPISSAATIGSRRM